jgi:ATP-dependent exoDNAse (exonuclease V) alpha subunit
MQHKEITLSTGQSEFLEFLKTGRNIFLTGKAGTGKSYIVKEGIELLKSICKKVIAIAPTGIAANNIGGQTIHSMFNINPFGVANFEECNFLKPEKRRLLDNVDVIFIDEISMLRPDVLDAINWTLLKNGCKNLSSKQIVFIGDLKQLPSPINDNTRSILYRTYDGEEFYHALIYKKLNVINIELHDVLRQSNMEFIEQLNIIREGGKSPYFKQFVSTETKGVVLAPHNSTVEKYNKIGLDSINSKEFVFEAEVSVNLKADYFNLKTVLKVKNGCKIMYLTNSFNGDLVNGTLGIFVSHNNCHYIRVGDINYAINKIECTKKEYVFNKKKNDLELIEVGSITQYPIKLAYALSIHKSQGLSFDEITIDLKKPCFQKGQLYVALSRVRSPEGLRIII